MTPNFVTLPSGLRINTAHILEYREDLPGKTVIHQSLWIPDPKEGMKCISFTEDMTAEQLDTLLQPQSPLISPIPTPGSLNYGKPFSFSYEGKPLHGVIDGYGMRPDTSFYIRICADGEYYLCKLGTNLVVKDK